MDRKPGYIMPVWVATCGYCTAQESDSHELKSTFVRALRDYGWKNTRAFGWICPDCMGRKPAAPEESEE